MSEPTHVTYTVAAGERRRVRYEPRTDAPGQWRIEQVWTGCTWRTVGREHVQMFEIVQP
ncbi:hypothetical protein JCM17823_04910 [Halorubrum gandharaense]